MASYWFERGRRDAARNKGPLFREQSFRGVYAVGEVPEDWTAEEEQRKGREYLDGYESEESC